MSQKHCNSVFQLNDGGYSYTYSCALPPHGNEKLHVCDHIVIKDVSYGTGNKYRKADTIHWSIDGGELRILEKVLPSDCLTGESYANITGEASEKYPGTYGKNLQICVYNRTHHWNDGSPPTSEKVYCNASLLWR